MAYAAPAPSNAASEVLTVRSIPGGKTRTYGGPEPYAYIGLSPSGKYLAAIVQAESKSAVSRVLIYATATGAAHAYVEPAGFGGSVLAWSPDSSRLAVLGTYAELLNPEGQLVTSAGRSMTQTSGTVTESSGGYQWAADSSTFWYLINGSLLTLHADGTHPSAVPSGAGDIQQAGVPTASGAAAQTAEISVTPAPDGSQTEVLLRVGSASYSFYLPYSPVFAHNGALLCASTGKDTLQWGGMVFSSPTPS